MQIILKSFHGKTIAIDADESDTIKVLKSKIFQSHLIPTREQVIHHPGGQTDDRCTLAHYGVIQNYGGVPRAAADLLLLLHRRELFDILVKEVANEHFPPFSLCVGVDWTVLEFKQAIQMLKGVPIANQRLFWINRTQLENKKKLSDYSIEVEVWPYVKLEILQTMQLKVKTITGKFIQIDVEPSDTIAMVKAKICNDFPPDHLLIVASQPLQDNRTVEDYDIRPNISLHIQQDPRTKYYVLSPRAHTTDSAAASSDELPCTIFAMGALDHDVSWKQHKHTQTCALANPSSCDSVTQTCAVANPLSCDSGIQTCAVATSEKGVQTGMDAKGHSRIRTKKARPSQGTSLLASLALEPVLPCQRSVPLSSCRGGCYLRSTD